MEVFNSAQEPIYDFSNKEEFLNYLIENPPVIKYDDFDHSQYVSFGGRDFRSLPELRVQFECWGLEHDEALELIKKFQ